MSKTAGFCFKALVVALLTLGAVVHVSSRSGRAAEPVTLTFRAWIDGSDYVHIQGNNMWLVHRGFQYQGLWQSAGGEGCPSDMSPYVWPAGDPHREVLVNAAPWIPQWPDQCGYDDAGQQSLNTYTKQGLPSCVLAASLTSSSIGDPGRPDYALASISIVQQPSAGNGYTTIVLLDDDPAYYAAYHEFSLDLKACAAPATPTATTQPPSLGGIAIPHDSSSGSGETVLWSGTAVIVVFALAGAYLRLRWPPSSPTG
jgi:hypothetical protein